jgi:hypothetical protein
MASAATTAMADEEHAGDHAHQVLDEMSKMRVWW